MKAIVAFALVALSGRASADILHTSTHLIGAGRLEGSSENRFSDHVSFEWIIFDPVGSASGERLTVLSLPFDPGTAPGVSASGTSGAGFEAAAVAFTDDQIEMRIRFTGLRTKFFYESGEEAGMVDLLYSESLFLSLGDEPFSLPSLAGLQIDEFRVTLLEQAITVTNEPDSTQIFVSYRIRTEILGTIPSPATAVLPAAGLICIARRRSR